jgi:hypothetical protein
MAYNQSSVINYQFFPPPFPRKFSANFQILALTEPRRRGKSKMSFYLEEDGKLATVRVCARFSGAEKPEPVIC